MKSAVSCSMKKKQNLNINILLCVLVYMYIFIHICIKVFYDYSGVGAIYKGLTMVAFPSLVETVDLLSERWHILYIRV